MKTLIENLCGKLTEWGIDPITLGKAIGIFLILTIAMAIFVIFPKLFVALLITVICVVMIMLIYYMLLE